MYYAMDDKWHPRKDAAFTMNAYHLTDSVLNPILPNCFATKTHE